MSRKIPVSPEAFALIEDARKACGDDKDMQLARLATLAATALQSISSGFVRALPPDGERGPSAKEARTRELAKDTMTAQELRERDA